MQGKPSLIREFYYLKEYIDVAKAKEPIDVWWLNRYLILDSIFNMELKERFNREMDVAEDGGFIVVQWYEIRLIDLMINGFLKSNPKSYQNPFRNKMWETVVAINHSHSSAAEETAFRYYGEEWLFEFSICYKEIFRRYIRLKRG